MSKYKPFKELEKTCVRDLKRLGFEARRNWAEQFAGASTRDITAQKGGLHLVIQCKYGLRPNLKEAWIQANTAKVEGEIPLGVGRFKNERNTLVVLSWSDFKRLLARL